jgi:surfeit locus 1 family protein
MTQSRRGPRSALGPTLTTIAVVLVLIGLGIWQLDRRTWKLDLIETRKARIAADAVDLPKAPDLKTMEYRRVTLRGRFLHDREMYLSGRSWAGRLGYHVITPLVLSDGGAVLVNRGWIPLDRRDPARRAAGQIAGELYLTGHLRAQPPKGPFSPNNDPAKNFWFQIDIPAMATYAKLASVRPFIVQASSPAPPGGFPRPVPVRIDLPNDHLKYALTWFALAIAFAVIYGIWMRRRPRA